MKIFDLDWGDFLSYLDDWDELAPASRLALTRLKANTKVEPDAFAEDLELLLERGFLTRPKAGSPRVMLERRCQPFARVLRSLIRQPILEQFGADALHAYLNEHFSRAEQCGLDCGGYGDRDALFARITSPGSLDEFLELDEASVIDWESRRDPNRAPFHRSQHPTGLLTTPAVLRAAQALVQLVRDDPVPTELCQLRSQLPDVSASSLAAALFAAVRYALVFPAMDEDDIAPVLTLWPTLALRLHRPAAELPSPIDCKESTEGGYLLEDLTHLLVQVSAAPPRLRGNDHALFEKARVAYEEGMVELPHPLDLPAIFPECTRSHRLDSALVLAAGLELLASRGRAGKDLRLEVNDAGQQWLAGNPKQRLAALLDPLRQRALAAGGRADPEPAAPGAPGGSHRTVSIDVSERPWDADDSQDEHWEDEDDWDDDDEWSGSEYDEWSMEQLSSYSWGLLPPAAWRITTRYHAGLAARLVEIFSALPVDGFLELRDFLLYHSETSNPLLEQDRADARADGSASAYWGRPSEQQLEDAWQGALLSFLHERLLALGGVRLAVHDGRLAGQLTPIGGYLLGTLDDFEFDEGGDAQIIVQPNFEIVFLTQSPSTEAAIGRFAQRVGRGVGTLFRVTRESIWSAPQGDDPLAMLERLSTHPVPDNVAHEIRGWLAQRRFLSLAPAWLIRCPDAATAERVVAEGGNRLERISETIVELPDQKAHADVIKRLAKKGIFVEGLGPSDRPRQQGRRRR